jgi:hypothetical protein
MFLVVEILPHHRVFLFLDLGDPLLGVLWNHTKYQPLYVLWFFLHILTYDKADL